MKLVELTIKNFKSLGDVTIKPSDLSVIIGPNGSGKTNLANAFAFMRDVYAIGLEAAVQKSGGFENIISAGNKYDANQIYVKTSVFLTVDEAKRVITLLPLYFKMQTSSGQAIMRNDRSYTSKLIELAHSGIIVSHSFSVDSAINNVNSEFYVSQESIKFLFVGVDPEFIVLERNSKFLTVKTSAALDAIPLIFEPITLPFEKFSSQQLLTTDYSIRGFLANFTNYLSAWSVYQLSPNTAKTPGVPTPNPTLSLYGSNLPVLVDHLIRKDNNIWQEILATMQRVVPTLTDITTGYLYNKTVGLFFHEAGFERPWNAEEVSDGTILALAMLCSVNDPRNTLVFIEEPENSLHPWILRELVNNFKHVAATKNIFITTHSPTLIDMFSPNDIWCISKSDRQTKLNRLTDIATELQADWEEGKYKLSDYLDMGLVPQAIPGGTI